MKKFGLFVFAVFLVAAPAGAIIIDTGTTYQCWDFNNATRYGIIGEGNNPYGDPVANINDLSGTGVEWTDNYGGWWGNDFMIILDIPNSPDNGPDTYKLLTIEMTYMGELATFWMMDPETMNFFDPVEGTLDIEYGDVWTHFTQQWRIEPNPRKELIAIGLKGATAPAAIDQICVDTICVPEPATMALLALGAGCVLRRRKRD